MDGYFSDVNSVDELEKALSLSFAFVILLAANEMFNFF